MSSSTIPSDALLMMTLAGLAAASGPAYQSVPDQEQTILSNLGTQLAQTSLATGGNWSVIWVGLTGDLANLAYIAKNTAVANTYAVVIRGTVFSLSKDVSEDTDVTSVAGFWSYIGQTAPKFGCADTKAVCIAQGALNAFTEVTGATFTDGTTLVQTLTALAQKASPSALTIYVCGHSLGGATTTTLALNLMLGTSWPTAPVFQVYTFAAPTAGMQAFATAVATNFPGSAAGTNSAWQVANAFDLVPTLWVGASMSAAENWYPGGPEAQQTTCIESLLSAMTALPGIHTYVQPAVTAVPLNQNQSVMDPNHVANTDADFLAQVAFQHANNTYLTLLAEATGVSPVPWITPCPGAPGAVSAVAGGGMLCTAAPPTFDVTVYWTPPAPDPASVLGAPRSEEHT